MKVRFSMRAVFIAALLAAAFGVADVQGQVESSIALSSIQVEVDRLAPGSTTSSADLLIDAGAATVTVDVNASAAGIITSITGPSGQVIDASTIGGFMGEVSIYVVAPGSPDAGIGSLGMPGNHTVFVFTPPEAGTYTVNFDGGAGLAEEVALITTLILASPVRLALFATQSTLVLGRTIILSAALFNGVVPITGAAITVDLSSDAGETASISFADDGVGADSVAGDGLYSGTYTPVGTGLFRATTVVFGTLPGIGDYRRTAAASFLIVPQSGIIAGTFAETLLDTNANTLIDILRLAFDVNIITAGDYSVIVEIQSPLGVSLFSSNVATLGTGSGTPISVDFGAAALLAVGEDGPYSIERVELSFINPTIGAVVVDEASNVGMTSAFTQASLERAPIILTGNVSDQAFDDDSDGAFDRLVVTVEIDIVPSGNYSWSYKLSAQDLTEIDFDSGSASLQGGIRNISVTFSGQAIGAAGINGPYRIRDLLLQGPGGVSLVASDLGQTSPYTASQFAGFSGGVAAPVFTSSSGGPQEMTAVAGQPFAHLVSVEDPDAGDQVTLDVAGVVAGMVLTPALPATGNPVNVAITWTPTGADLGLHTLTFTATDQVGNITVLDLNIRVVGDDGHSGCGGCATSGRDAKAADVLLPLLLVLASLVLGRRMRARRA